MSEQWTEQMQQKMAGYKRPAPEVSWEEIDRVLSANKARKTRLLWLRRMAAAIALLAIAGVGYWSILRHETEQVIEKHVAENHGDGSPDPVILPTQPAVPAIYARSLHKLDSTTIPVSELETIIPVSKTVTDTVDITVMEEKEQSHTIEENAKPIEPTRPVVIYPTDLHQRKHIDNRLMAKVYMSSTIRQAESSSLLKTIDPSGAFGDSTSIVLINQQIHHHQPVRIGLSLRYQLNDCLSVESGLLYTHLSSDITMTENGVTTTKKQHLNYIGLPLNISYKLWKSKQFGLYVTTGGTIEKSLGSSPWQFSLNGAVGAEYKLTNFFSLYAEPGLGYYFKDGSTTPTIYQDHPLNFNLSLGLRFNLK